MKMYTIPHRTYREIRDTARPGEIVLVPDTAYALETWERTTSFVTYLTRESTWTIRGSTRSKILGTITVTASRYVTGSPRDDRQWLAFICRQNARKVGRAFCEQNGIRWTP